MEEKNDEESLRTLTCDYDSDLGQRYSDMESEEEEEAKETVNKVYEQYASNSNSRKYSSEKSSASDYSSDEASIKDMEKITKKEQRETQIKN